MPVMPTPGPSHIMRVGIAITVITVIPAKAMVPAVRCVMRRKSVPIPIRIWPGGAISIVTSAMRAPSLNNAESAMRAGPRLRIIRARIATGGRSNIAPRVTQVPLSRNNAPSAMAALCQRGTPTPMRPDGAPRIVRIVTRGLKRPAAESATRGSRRWRLIPIRIRRDGKIDIVTHAMKARRPLMSVPSVIPEEAIPRPTPMSGRGIMTVCGPRTVPFVTIGSRLKV